MSEQDIRRDLTDLDIGNDQTHDPMPSEERGFYQVDLSVTFFGHSLDDALKVIGALQGAITASQAASGMKDLTLSTPKRLAQKRELDRQWLETQREILRDTPQV